MKPERLILSAWGPYPGQADIDFKRAGRDGLFLITGPTGSGKTTLFDGISFALFGEVSGSIRENGSLRSDFASPERETFVRLSFVHKNISYEIFRSPRYERPKKRGNGSITQAERAELFCEGMVKAEGAKEVTLAMQTLLGLNAVQFKQISMIAQGEFQKLLITGAKERTQIFRTIFHTRAVEMVGKQLSERARALYGSYNNLTQRIQEAVNSIEPEGEELAGLCREQADAAHILPALSEAVKKEKGDYKALEKEYAKTEQRERRLTLSLDGRKRRERLTESIREAEEELGHLTAGISVRMKRQEELVRVQAKERYTRAEEELQGIQEKKEALKRWKQEAQNIDRQARELAMLQQDYLLEEGKEKKLQEEYESLFFRYRRMSAGILARDLTEGEPCPVCGSLHHPKKALESEAVSKKELDQSRTEWETQQKKTQRLHEKVVECYAQLNMRKERLEEEKPDLLEEAGLIEKEAEFSREREENLKLLRELETLEQELTSERLLIERRKAQKESMEQELAACPPVEEENLAERLLECRTSMERLSRAKERLHACITVNEKAAKSIQEKLGEVTELKKQYGLLADVEKLIRGENPKRLVWEQYVLAVYFETVLHAANLRLLPMTDGRYEMFRVESIGDLRTRDSLEIEVLDHYTGKRRSAKSLSGGEAFKAALSLALGMSDMIQSYAGGIEVDALFIDEGFGALDAQSLEQALNVLQGLTKKSCMIGIISHVQELKDRIENQIVIEKTSTGSLVKGGR